MILLFYQHLTKALMYMLGLFYDLTLCGYFLKQHNKKGIIKLKFENSKLSNRDIIKKMEAEL